MGIHLLNKQSHGIHCWDHTYRYKPKTFEETGVAQISTKRAFTFNLEILFSQCLFIT